MRGIFFISSLALLSVISADAFAADPGFISFKDAERLAIKNSPQIAAQRYTADAAYQQATAQKLKRLPTITLSAQSTFVSKIGQIEIPSMGITQQVGSRTNWSVMPALNLIVWDTGQVLKKAKSMRYSADSQSNILDLDRRQALLSVRTAYVGVQLAEEQVRLVKEALQLARAQYAYVHDRYKVGTSDKYDLTVAHQEMTDREKDLDEAEGELIVAKRGLLAALAIEDEITSAESVRVEPIDTALSQLLPRSDASFDPSTHPQVKALANQSLSSTFASKSTVSRYFPEITLKGMAGYQYPNLGQNETVQQNQLLLNLNMPIFEWGKIWREAKSEKFQARSSERLKDQTSIDLMRDAYETKDRIATDKKLQLANKKVVADAIEVAKLSFDSYKAGKIIFLDVQRANVKELSAKVDAARNDADLAVQISRLLALATDEGDLNE